MCSLEFRGHVGWMSANRPVRTIQTPKPESSTGTSNYGRQTINNKNKSQPTPECLRLWVLGAGRTGGGLF